MAGQLRKNTIRPLYGSESERDLAPTGVACELPDDEIAPRHWEPISVLINPWLTVRLTFGCLDDRF